MKTISTLLESKIFHFIFIFLTSVAFGFALTNQFLLNHPDKHLLISTASWFLLAVVFWQKSKNQK